MIADLRANDESLAHTGWGLPEPSSSQVCMKSSRLSRRLTDMRNIQVATQATLGSVAIGERLRLSLWSLPGASGRRTFNCPQGTQCGLLRLGQAPDGRDIEALVGPVTPQPLQQIAAVEIPDVDDTIIPAT